MSRRIAIIAAASIAAQTLLACAANAQFKDGYYSDLRVNGSSTGVGEPDYGLLVEGGRIVADFSFDDYGCMGRGCNFESLIQRNTYEPVNELQILRKTPDGKAIVVTWYKNPGE